MRTFLIPRCFAQQSLEGRTAVSWLLIAACILIAGVTAASAQQPTSLFSPSPTSPPTTVQAVPLPATPSAEQPAPPPASPPVAPQSPAAQEGRVFCDQNVAAQPADPRVVPERYREFAGIFSDAAWTPQLCAALVVETISDDGTATITYAFGPMGSGGKTQGGVLHGTGVVKDGALLFQNADGSQYSFKPYYSDLAGHWTAPNGQNYEAIFKRAY
jgi:hypothetical protein